MTREEVVAIAIETAKHIFDNSGKGSVEQCQSVYALQYAIQRLPTPEQPAGEGAPGTLGEDLKLIREAIYWNVIGHGPDTPVAKALRRIEAAYHLSHPAEGEK